MIESRMEFYHFFQYQYASKSDKFLMTIGIICSIITGVCQPLNTFIFGSLTGDMIELGKQIYMSGNDTEKVNELSNELFDTISTFAFNNSMIGLAMLIFSYVSISLFNFTGLRQVI